MEYLRECSGGPVDVASELLRNRRVRKSSEEVPKEAANYCQGEFEKRVRAGLPLVGVSFLAEARARFPRTRAKPLTDEQVLARLEEINPGWREWAGSFGQRARP